MSLFGGSVVMGIDQFGVVVTVVVISALLWWLFSKTHLGIEIRAVVDRRELAQLASINANRVSAIAWAMGAGLAGLTGVLLAPTAFGLDTYRLTLLVIETFSVAVLAKLTSLPLAVLAGLGLGLASSYLTQFSFAYLGNWIGAPETFSQSLAALLDPIIPNISVFVLFGALLLYRSLDAGGGTGETGSFAAKAMGAGRKGVSRLRWPVNAGILAIAVLLPLTLDLAGFRAAHGMVALAIVFLSIVAVTGFSGHITLAQAGFAGFGALMTARIHNGNFFMLPEMPIIPAMIIAGLLCVPLGFIAGYPALRRRGLFLALTTLALGLILERFVFQNLYFVSGPGATVLSVPRSSGWTSRATWRSTSSSS
jgi:branched-chain amino acid transport system permease protein